MGCAAAHALALVTRASDVKHLAQPINRLMCAQLVNQRERSCSSDIKSAVAFLIWFSLAQDQRSGPPVLGFLLLWDQRLALRSDVLALFLNLVNPAAQR